MTFPAPLLPFELIGHIADYMDYNEVQLLRLISKHFCCALEHRALARLSLDWHTSPCGRIHHFPLEKVQAYTQPGKTPGIYHVRHLSIHNICMDLKYCDTPFDRLLRLPDYYDHDYMSKRELMRTQVYQELVEQLILGDGMRKVQTIRWHMGCSTHKYSGSTCIYTFNRICELLSSQQEVPLQRLELVIGSPVSMYRLQSLGPMCFPRSKKLVMVDPLDEAKSSALFLQCIKRLTVDQRSLEYVDMNLVYNESLFAELFPNKGPSSSRHTRNFPQHLSLVITVPSFHIESHVFGHFHHLQSLTFTHHKLIRAGTNDASFKAFWQQMLSEQIFVERLTYPALGVEETFITYLAAYPKPSLRYLNLKYDLKPSNDSLGMFFTKAFPIIAPGLETLHMPVYRGPGKHQICHDTCMESIAHYKQCVSLQHLELPMSLDPIHHGRIGPYLNDLIHITFKGHPHLKTVTVFAVTRWHPTHYAQHTVKLLSRYQNLPVAYLPAPAHESPKRSMSSSVNPQFLAPVC